MQRRAALTDGPSIVEPRSGAAGRKNAGQAAEPSIEARIQVTSRDDRGQRQWDTGSPPFCCWMDSENIAACGTEWK